MSRAYRRRSGGIRIAAKWVGGILACALVCGAVFLIAGFFTEAVQKKLNSEPTPSPTVATDAIAETVNANPLLGAIPSPGATALPAAHASLQAGAGEAVDLPLSGLLIGIDPGHQASGNSEQEPIAPGSDETKPKVSSGTQGVATGTPEFEVNLIIALKLRDALEGMGADVVMTRTINEINISNIERAQLMNEAGADLVLRLHCNGSTDSSVRGIGLYVNATGEIAEASYDAAKLLLEAMTTATGARAAGIFRRDTYTGLNWSQVPCVLVEMGYMSNPEEDIQLESAEYQAMLVDGMVSGIAEVFSRDLPG